MGPGRIDHDLSLQTLGADQGAEDTVGRRRATDVTHADEQNPDFSFNFQIAYGPLPPSLNAAAWRFPSRETAQSGCSFPDCSWSVNPVSAVHAPLPAGHRVASCCGATVARAALTPAPFEPTGRRDRGPGLDRPFATAPEAADGAGFRGGRS
jgi:hypothetical protein